MVTKLARWGNSLGLRIPKAVAEKISLQDGGEVEIRVEKGKLIVEPVAAKRYTLDELVAGITAANRHEETVWGPPVGREVW